MTTEDVEAKPFMADEEGTIIYENVQRSQAYITAPRNLKIHRVLFVLHIIFLALNLAFLFWNFTATGDCKIIDKDVNTRKKAYSE